jgi:hypothetical protein
MEAIMKTYLRSAFFLKSALAAASVTGFSVAAAVAPPPGGLAVAASGKDLTLSFATASLSFYAVQSSTDLQHWTNSQSGVMGDGTTKTVLMSNAVSSGPGFYRLLVQTPTRLLLPQSTAFAILGHSCGGIQETVAAGFDVTNGYPTGQVNLSTRCGGSGRGGGYQTTTYSASAVVVWDFAGNAISATPLTNGGVVPPLTGADGLGDIIYSTGGAAYLIVPVPAVPTGVTVLQTNDQFLVSWIPAGANPLAVSSSALTATPVNSTAPILASVVAGSATSGFIPSFEPATTYQITVANLTIGGTGRTSVPVSVTTDPATIPPSAPTGVAATWSNADPAGATDTLIATWQAANPGNSPVDEYLITITGSDGGGTFTQTVSGATLTAYFDVNFVPNWSVTVQAHNAAGWGPKSPAANLGGL